MTLKNSLWKLLGCLALGLVVGFVLGVLGTQTKLGDVVYDTSELVGDVYNGINHTLMMRNGQFVGPIANISQSSSFATTTTNGLATYSPNAISTTTSGGTAVTLAQADLLGAQYYTFAIDRASDFTITLPATSTLTSFLPNSGESTRMCFSNSTTTADRDLIFVAGTGIDLEVASSSPLFEMIGPTDSGCIEFQRKANSDIFARFTSFDDSD